MSPANVFILNDSHPENIEIRIAAQSGPDGRLMAEAFCPRCRYTSAYVSLFDGDERAAMSAAIRQLAEQPCNVHIGQLAGNDGLRVSQPDNPLR